MRFRKTKAIEKKQDDQKLARRDFIKFGSIGAAAGVIAAASIQKKSAAKMAEDKMKNTLIKEHDDFPYEVSKDYKPHPSYSTVHGHAFFGRALGAMGVEVDLEAQEQGDRFIQSNNYHFDPDKKGYDQKSKAVMAGSWALSNTGAGPMPGAVGDFGLLSWDNNPDKYPLALMDLNFVPKTKAHIPSGVWPGVSTNFIFTFPIFTIDPSFKGTIL